MSIMIMDAASIANLCRLINSKPFTCQKKSTLGELFLPELIDEETDEEYEDQPQAYAEMFQRANLLSFQMSYPDREVMAEPMPEVPRSGLLFDGWMMSTEVRAEFARLLKLVHCLDYNLALDKDDLDNPEIQAVNADIVAAKYALQEISKHVSRYLVDSMPDYREAAWG